MTIQEKYHLSDQDIDRIVGMAWEDRTPWEAIESQFGVSESTVIEIMRYELKPSSWRMWRERVQGRKTKHQKRRGMEVERFKCSRQKMISMNKISKRSK
jgi:uncharacterized protein (TIGR03643 family)